MEAALAAGGATTSPPVEQHTQREVRRPSTVGIHDQFGERRRQERERDPRVGQPRDEQPGREQYLAQEGCGCSRQR